MAGDLNEKDNEGKKEASTNSSDPIERKLARRLRIQRRLDAAKKLQAIADGIFVEPEPEKPLIDETIENSEETLRQLFLEGKDLISNMLIASDSKEVARREKETKEKAIRMDELKQDTTESLQKLEEITNKWNTILETTSPLELHQHMNEQKAKCLLLIEQKNEMIKNFQLELKLADEKFMKDRKEMCEELGLLTSRIDEQVMLMKKAFRTELLNIEESVDITREQTMEKHLKKWESLYSQREKEETDNMEKKFEMVRSFHGELQKLHLEHEEKYRATKIHLEKDIQVLERELEQVKALCLLNSEKLDYNYQVLKKREEENVYIKNHQKRRLNKLQDIVNDLKKKIDDKKQSTEEEFRKLTKEVYRYHGNVLEAEEKAIHFSKLNDDKFLSIWDMKEEEANNLVKKILNADEVIYEQVLGLTWNPPQITSVTKNDLDSYKTAASLVKNNFEKKDIVEIPGEGKDLRENDTSPEVLDGHRRLLRLILGSVADLSGFLMEEKLDELLQPFSADEKAFVQLENVFVAIGIKSEKDMETMKKLFLPYTVCLYCDKRKNSSVSGDTRREPTSTVLKPKKESRHSILQSRDLEEKVSKLRMQKQKEVDDDDLDVISTRRSTRDSRARSLMSQDSRDFFDKRESIVGYRRESSIGTKRDTNSRQTPTTPESKDDGPPVSTQAKQIQCNITHPLIIEKHYVLRALRDFVAVFNANKCKVLTGIESRLEKKRFTISRLLSETDIENYWEKFKALLPVKLDFFWNGIFLALTRYYSVLQVRHKVNTKVRAIRRQNIELKRLLAHYRPKTKREEWALPDISSVPDDPIDIEFLANIANKLAY